MIKACIFDLDGVIVDTAKYHFQAWRRLANDLGFDFTEKQNEQLKGVSRMESLDIILGFGNRSLSQEDKLKYCALKNEWYVEFISKMDQSEILDGAVDLLDELIDQKIKIALGSASKNAVPLLTQLGIIDRFEIIVDGTKTTKSKPDPQVFLMGAKGLGVNPNESVVFEDSISGIQAAQHGGFHNVAIGEEDNFPTADFIIAGLHEISYKRIMQIFN